MTTYRFGGKTVTGVAALNGMRDSLVSLANHYYRQARDCQTFDEEEALTSWFLSRFMDGIAACFAYEEEMMTASFYPDREDHQQEHDGFIDRLYAVRRRHKLGEPAMAFEIFHEIREWFLSHGEFADGRLWSFLERTEMFRVLSCDNAPSGSPGKAVMYGQAEVSSAN